MQERGKSEARQRYVRYSMYSMYVGVRFFFLFLLVVDTGRISTSWTAAWRDLNRSYVLCTVQYRTCQLSSRPSKGMIIDSKSLNGQSVVSYSLLDRPFEPPLHVLLYVEVPMQEWIGFLREKAHVSMTHTDRIIYTPDHHAIPTVQSLFATSNPAIIPVGVPGKWAFAIIIPNL